MPRFWVPVVVSVALLVPTNGNAQSQQTPEPPPQVTAVNADWHVRGEPIFYASNFYWPAGPDIFFDGAVMVRTGQYEGIPLYANPFLPSYSVVYVPIGGGIVRPYMLRAPVAGQLGSAGAPPPHVALPALPPAIVAAAPVGASRAEVVVPSVRTTSNRAVGTAGAVGTSGVVGTSGTMARGRTTISTPPRGSKNGIWLAFNGVRYYSAGPAVQFSPNRFVPVGSYGGFPVYRERSGSSDAIYVAAVQDGPLAPYRR